MKAFDAATGKLVWAKSMSYPATGGMLATGGGLVFYGDPEGYFNAVNDETGEALWQFQTGSGIYGNPTTYTAGGKQYVAIVYGAGGGGILHHSGLGQCSVCTGGGPHPNGGGDDRQSGGH